MSAAVESKSGESNSAWLDESETKFLSNIIQASRQGYDFIPFIGSGVSAQSGILMGNQFTDYLAYTTALVCGLVTEQEVAQVPAAPKRNLRSEGWPAYPNSEKVAEVRKVLKTCFVNLCKDSGWLIDFNETGEISHVDAAHEKGSHRFASPELSRVFIPSILRSSPQVALAERTRLETLRALGKYEEMLDFSTNPAFSTTSEERIVECALRSLHDWKATLRFLDRVRIREDGRMTLGLEDGTVIDSFNAHIIAGRQPNFGHTLLAHLAEPLRFRVLLTTNFDSLTKDAFDNAHKPLRVFEVGVKGRFPAIEILQAQDCLIQLHGGLSETRADLTLDEVPGEEDCKTFRRLFSGKPKPDHGKPFLPAHLLVIGYSAGDMRCVRFIKSLLDHRKNAQVFWVCYNTADRNKLDVVFTETSYRPRLHRCITRRPDLLLYELHQKLTYHLPGGGVSYQYSHRMPPWLAVPNDRHSKMDPWEWGLNDRTNNELKYPENAADLILDGTEPEAKNAMLPKRQQCAGPDKSPSKAWWKIDGDQHVARHGASLCTYLQIEKNKNCLWLELTDYVDARAVVFEFLRTIALRRGNFQQEHLIYLPGMSGPDAVQKPEGAEQLREHLKKLVARLGISPSDWFLFLYGRDGPGACAGWHDQYQWPEGESEALTSYLDILACCGFRVILMPFSENRRRRLKELEEAATACLKGPVALEGWDKNPFKERISALEKRANDYLKALKEARMKEGKGVENLWENVTQRANELRFIYGLTLFRQSRHYTALCNEAIFPCPNRFNIVGKDNDVERYQRIEQWVMKLCDEGILRNKPGGTLWMYRDVRLGARGLLETLEEMVNEQDRPGKRKVRGGARLKLKDDRHRYHFFIAEWYQRVFLSTGNHIPLLEALYHFTQSAVQVAKREDKEEVVQHRWEQCLVAMIKLLHIARPALKFWMQTSGKVLEIFAPNTGSGPPRSPDSSDWKGIITVLNECCQFKGPKTDNLKQQLETELDCLTQSLKAEAGSDSIWQIQMGAVPEDLSQSPRPSQAKSKLPAGIPDDVPPDMGKLGDPEPRPWSLGFVKREAEIMGDVPPSKSYQSFVHFAVSLLNPENGQKITPDDLTDRINAAVIDCLNRLPTQDSIPRSTRIYKMAALLGEFCFQIVRRAKLRHHGSKRIPLRFVDLVADSSSSPKAGRKAHSPAIEERNKIRDAWVAVCALAIAATKLCSCLHPFFLDREVVLRIKLLDLNGLALAHLDRYFEAHRRFTEVSGWLSKVPVADAHVLRARTELRKAEGHLLEAKRIRKGLVSHAWEGYLSQAQLAQPSGNLLDEDSMKIFERLHTAKLDDAWLSLERAQVLLSGTSHSTMWWGRIICLQLQCYGELYPMHLLNNKLPHQDNRLVRQEPPPSPRVLRRRVNHLEHIRQLLQQGELISPTELYRRCRFLEYAMEAAVGYKAYQAAQNSLWDFDKWRENTSDWLKKDFGDNFKSIQKIKPGYNKDHWAVTYREKLAHFFGSKRK